MFYIIISSVIIGAMIAVVVDTKRKDFIIFFCCLVTAVLCLVVGACHNHYVELLYSDLSETGYVNIEYIYDKPQYYELELLPNSEDKYIEYVNNGYKYCIKNKDGDYITKNTNSSIFSKVDVVYTDDNQPFCVVKSGKEISTLTKRPNIWFNLFQWWVVKDINIGDIVKEGPLDDIYTFHLPYNK